MKLATLCYVEKDERYLMLHRNKVENDMHQGMWVGLGGKFEPGESPEECVIREVFEESGLQITNPKLRGILTFPNNFNIEDWYVFLFTATDFSGTLKQCNEGTLEWVEKSKVSTLPMYEGDYLFLNGIDEHNSVFSIKYNYQDDVLKDYKLTFY